MTGKTFDISKPNPSAFHIALTTHRVSASMISCITVRTIGRRKSPSSAIIALISLVVLLLSFRVMVRYLSWLFSIPTAYDDLPFC
jgi:hypothetical protein